MNLTMYTSFADTVRRYGWEAAADIAKGYGCSSVEPLEITEPYKESLLRNTEEAKEAFKILSSRCLKVACYSVFSNVYKSPETVRLLKFHAELAAALGSPFLHHTLLPWFDTQENLPEFSEAMECAIDSAEEIAKHAEKLGVTCIYEDQGFFVNGIEGYGIFFSEMKRRCKNVGVCGDTGNCLFADLPAEEFFKANIRDIKHVHVKDYFRKDLSECPGEGWYKSAGGTWLHDAPLGEGIVNIDACMKILRDAGYCGAISIETEEVQHSVKYLRRYERT